MRRRKYSAALAVIDGELWSMIEDSPPERHPNANPRLVEAIAAKGPGWHYGTFGRMSLADRMQWHVIRLRRRIRR